MHSLKFDIDELESKLSALPPAHRVAFAASCCEQILPQDSDESPDTYRLCCAGLRSRLDRIWLAVPREELSLDILRAAKASCGQSIPAAEVFAADRLSAALCASRAVRRTAQCLNDASPRYAAEAAAHAVASITTYIRSIERTSGSRRAEKLMAAQSMLADELQRQEQLLERLSSPSERKVDVILHPWLREPSPASYVSGFLDESRAAA